MIFGCVGVILACIVVALGLLYATHQGKGFVRLLQDARIELRRVTWPTKQDDHDIVAGAFGCGCCIIGFMVF